MGNAALRDVAVIEPVADADVAGAVVAVDAHNWLYRYLTTTVQFTSDDVYTTSDGDEVANLVGALQGVAKLLELDVTPVFVFDGGVTELKAEEVERRREQRERAAERLAEAREAGDALEVARLDSRTQRLTDVIHETTRGLLAHLDLPVVEAPAEGEAQAAHMARQGGVDAAVSEDYDTLLFGAPTTYRKLTASDDTEAMSFDATLATHDLTWEQLVDAAILVGTDFNEGVHGYGPKTAVSAVREHGDLWGVLEDADAYVEHADRIRTLFLDPDVTDDYDVDPDPSPDLDAARAYVTEEWEVDADAVAGSFERIGDAVAQTGLGEWT
ncbi:MAG: flap endonuclease-1 [Halobacteriaceae archaeon]